MATIKAYTDLEQSKKLAEILPLESADMYYCYGMDIYTKVWSFDGVPTIIDNSNQIDVDFDIPCWSLAALLGVLPKIHKLKPILDLEENSVQYSGINLYIVAGNPIDACVEMILKLHELDLV